MTFTKAVPFTWSCEPRKLNFLIIYDFFLCLDDPGTAGLTSMLSDFFPLDVSSLCPDKLGLFILSSGFLPVSVLFTTFRSLSMLAAVTGILESCPKLGLVWSFSPAVWLRIVSIPSSVFSSFSFMQSSSYVSLPGA